MTATFFTNFLLGFAVAAVIGPVNLTTMRYGLDDFWKGVWCMTGSAVSEIAFLVLTASGIIFIFNDPAIMRLLWFCGGFALLYLAVTGWKTTDLDDWSDARATTRHPFAAGFLVDFLNPFSMVWWMTVIGSMILANLEHNSIGKVYLDGSGVVLGIATCLFVMLCAVRVAKRHVTGKIIRLALKLSSVALLGFAVWFFYRFYLSFIVVD